MENRWSDDAFQQALDRWGPQVGEAVAARLYSARLIGAEPDLVLHGGGNVSAKDTARNIFDDEIEVVYIKASGGDMSCLEPDDLPPLRLKQLRRLRTLALLDDDAMVNQIRLQLLRSTAPTPSIETLLHAFLPHRFVDHSHADAVLALTNQAGGDRLIRDALGDEVAVIPYIRPGFELAKAVAACVQARPSLPGVVLMFHGLITFADDAKTSYDRHIEICTRCERFIEANASAVSETRIPEYAEAPEKLARRAAPLLRGALAEATADEDHPYRMSILEWRGDQEVLDFMHSDRASRLCLTGTLTGDHVMHTRLWPLLVADPAWDDLTHRRTQIAGAIRDFREKYRRYLEAHGGIARETELGPRVVLLPGAGLFAAGPTKAAAIVTADIAAHTLKVKMQADLVGQYQSLSDEHLFDMEFRTIQRDKLKAQPEGLLAGQVVMISGAAGVIGAATAECCARAGAHVFLTDIDESRLGHVVDFLNSQLGPVAAGTPMDVTDEESVKEGFAHAALAFGGVDTVVPNAGVAHVAPFEELTLADFRRVMDVNAFGYFLFMREGLRLMKQQGTGGNIVVIASKNVFAPGKDFAAYSASKAAAHQLGKVAALESASFGIRVNMINPDAVFGDVQPSGLWEAIAPSRAQSRNLAVEDLPEFYRQRNLLKARIHARHVGNAVVFFASRQTPTTGATLPVDGGILEAFPR